MRRYPSGSVVLAGFSQGAGLAMAAAAAECAWSPVLGGRVVQSFFTSLESSRAYNCGDIDAVCMYNDYTFASDGLGKQTSLGGLPLCWGGEWTNEWTDEWTDEWTAR